MRASLCMLAVAALASGCSDAAETGLKGKPTDPGVSPKRDVPSPSSPKAGFAGLEMRLSQSLGVTIAFDQYAVVDTEYGFWGPKWKWAGPEFRLNEAGDTGYKFCGEVPRLKLKLACNITKPQPNSLRFTYELDAAEALTDIVGGGLQFSTKPNALALGGRQAEPALLADNRGWTWDIGAEAPITVTFEPPLAELYFERGMKEYIRTFFIGKTLPKGQHKVVMTVTLPKGGTVVPSLAERYGTPDASRWNADALAWDDSPVDLSFLNDKPAGKHGFLRAKGDQLVFDDGTAMRFWGGNIAAYSVFASKEGIKTQARRIAKLGYNLVRCHHHDAMGWIKPNVIDETRDDSQHLYPQGMEKLDWWIKCLRDEGVYVWLDLMVDRKFKPGDEVLVGFSEILRKGGEGRGFCYYNERVQELMKDFNAKYLSHVNPHTGLAYKDDPAIIAVLISNENDLTNHFGNLMLPDKGNPIHNKLFDAAVRAFCARTGLPYDRTWRTWQPGPSKIFLNDREHQFNQAMIAPLRQLGLRVPIVTTNYFGNATLCALPALTDGDIIDAHAYGSSEALSVNPRYEASYIPWMASVQVYGKPVSVSEWNVPTGNVDRFTAPLYLMSIASLQGWDAPMIYTYAHQALDRPSDSHRWSTFLDPALTALMPAAAIAFRQGHIKGAAKTYCLKLPREELYDKRLSADNVPAIRTLVEQSRLTIGLPDVPELVWDRATTPAEGVLVVTDPNQDFIPQGQTYVESDTGELRRDWRKGIQTINTTKTQAAHGWIGGETIELTDVTLRITTPKAAVVVTSLDGAPIAASLRLLITTVARAAADGGKLPFRSEPVEGELRIRSTHAGMHLTALGGDGASLGPHRPEYAEGAYRIKLPAAKGTHWYLLAAADAPR